MSAHLQEGNKSCRSDMNICVDYKLIQESESSLKHAEPATTTASIPEVYPANTNTLQLFKIFVS